MFIDDGEGVRSGLRLLLSSAGLDPRTYSSAAAFLEAVAPDQAGCLLLACNSIA